ncbi:AAA family ATPase [Nocardia brasiliensis]|uniref:AAA family ATPase n=1 Tax=Nocardia brasiliensis TaxID=37326 RepID=UPI00142E62D2|nr:AAA family ATPase [Nocardia brasiliensis]
MTEYVLSADEQERLEVHRAGHARQRFPTFTLAEAAAAVVEQGDWLVPDLIASTSTLVFGEAKIGKSWLIAHLVAALLSRGEFLGVQVPDEEFSVGICYTDDAGHREYAQRIGTAVEGVDHAVKLYGLRIMQRDDWEALHRVVTDAGHNVLIIDNLTQILDGSINDDDVIRRCFNGIRRFTQAGIPVVIVGHSTDKPGQNGRKSDTPLGSAAISQSVRWLMQIRPARGRNLNVKTYGNIDHGRTMTVQPDDGALFTVLSSDEKAETVKKARQRSVETMDKNAEYARFVIEQCQGKGRNEAGDALAEKFGGSAGTFKNSLTRGPLSKLVTRTGTQWQRVER